MLIIAHHSIHDPEAFWSAAKEVKSVMPSGMKLHAVYPSLDLRSGTCLWEASSTAEVQHFLDEFVGKSSENSCYQVNVSAAIGLPIKLDTTPMFIN